MLENFEIKKALFKDQIHERYLFSLNFKGHDYEGIYNEGDITWFNPHPRNDLKEIHLDKIESKVDVKMQKLLS
ncbi:DUF5342 family protein [Lederbergia citrea]|uniref:DUF5342 family protein n=1 Tax=Lederbergia citrea TaxID=2833581 RepID=UPI001BC8FF11|nr:DUF5342 family protein [Lederbergia citrea]MBS4205753.1 DUF5342 family protein [Lederbergia citrea]